MPEHVSMERNVREWAVAEASPAELTLCVRGMRGDSSTTELMRFVDSRDFGGEYDFLHVPMDFRSKKCFGYAFINFVSPAAAKRFVQEVAFGGLSKFAAGSEMNAIPSKRQGLAECLISWYRSHSRSVRSVEVFPFVRPLHSTAPVNPYLEIQPNRPRATDIPIPAFVPRHGAAADLLELRADVHRLS
jgi:hypothetical protein